jgi:MoaA/NifB/PqqE/SkfB family radical SAM enzyme
MEQEIKSNMGHCIVIWDITSQCNLRCCHCYNADKYFNNKQNFEELSTIDAQNAIDILKYNDIKHIHLLGGEPLIRQDIFYLINYIRSKNINVSLTTNATLLTKEICFNLIKYNVNPIFISLDGVNKETSDFIRGQGTYDLVCKNINLLQNEIKKHKSAIEIIVSFTVTNRNKSEIPLLPDFCVNLGIDQINLSCLYEAGNSCDKKNYLQYEISDIMIELEKMADRLQNMKNPPKIISEFRPRFTLYLNRRYYKQKSIKYTPVYSRCLAGGPLFYMEANGDLHPCHATNNTKGKQAQKEGYLKYVKTNILDYINKEIEKSQYIASFNMLKKTSNYKQKLKTCKECAVFNDCDPCPINFYDSFIVPECEWLKQHELQYYKKLLSLVPSINNKSNYVAINSSGNYVLRMPTEGISQEIFSQINCHNSFQQIIKAISTKYSDVPYDTLMRDVCEYLLDLRCYGVVNF